MQEYQVIQDVIRWHLLVKQLVLDQQEAVEDLQEDLQRVARVSYETARRIRLAAQRVRQFLLYLLDVRVDVAKVTDEAFAHFRMALDLLHNPLFV